MPTPEYHLAMPRRGNPDWGKFVPFSPALPTEFEREVRKLRLAKEMYVGSVKLRVWCERNKNRVYIPEWLLKAWGTSVDVPYSG